MLFTESAGTGGGETREATVARLSRDMLDKLPMAYDPNDIELNLNRMGKQQSMVIFLGQEIDRMQKVWHLNQI